jgi:hypothetical protein
MPRSAAFIFSIGEKFRLAVERLERLEPASPVSERSKSDFERLNIEL